MIAMYGADFSELVGKTLVSVERQNSGLGDSESIVFTTDAGDRYGMYYEQDCCASCYIEDIAGDLNDLVGSPIVRAEENGNDEVEPPSPEETPESFTWTFYRIATANGLVVIRWYGSSNGYYSERATFSKLPE